MKAAAANPNSKVYWGCFDGGHLTHLDDTKEYFYLFSMNHLGQWSEAEEIEPQSASLQIAHYIHKDLKSFAKSSPGQSLPKADVFIAGHSHGGWMAMKVAYQMTFIENAKLQQLLTIDPISYTLCASHWFPFHILYNTFNWFGEPDNCHKAPADLDHITPTIAQTADNRWINMSKLPKISDTMPLPIRIGSQLIAPSYARIGPGHFSGTGWPKSVDCLHSQYKTDRISPISILMTNHSKFTCV
jgi:hypothetical protein